MPIEASTMCGRARARRERRANRRGRTVTDRRAAEVCQLLRRTTIRWPIERISEIVQPTAAQRPRLDIGGAASAKASNAQPTPK